MSLALRAACFALTLWTVAGDARAHATGVPRSAGTEPAHLRISVDIEPTSLIPFFETGHLLSHFSSLIFDPLTTVDDRGDVIPRLASRVPTRANGGISSDGRTIRFQLRRDVRWQDGAPFTSRDVAFTQSVLDDDRNGIPGERLVAKVDTPDRYSVVFHLEHRSATAILNLFNGSSAAGFVLPAHLLQNVRDLRRAAFNGAPIGTGPFRVTRWRRGLDIELVANDRYYLRRPGLRRITIDIFPATESQVAALRRHETDWDVSIDGQAMRALQNAAGVRIAAAPQYAWYAIAFNLESSALRDIRVRRAIALAIDRQKIAKAVYLNMAAPATGDIPAFSWAYPSHARGYPFDPSHARRLLRQAGWRQADPLVITSVPFHAQLAVNVQAMLRAIGIETTIRVWPLPLYYAPKAMGGVVANRRFDLGVIGSWSPPDPDEQDDFACAVRPGVDGNAAGYCNPALDRLVAASLATDDRSRRKRVYARIEATLQRDLPYLFIAWPLAMTAISTDLHGFRPGPGPFTWNAADWTI